MRTRQAAVDNRIYPVSRGLALPGAALAVVWEARVTNADVRGLAAAPDHKAVLGTAVALLEGVCAAIADEVGVLLGQREDRQAGPTGFCCEDTHSCVAGPCIPCTAQQLPLISDRPLGTCDRIVTRCAAGATDLATKELDLAAKTTHNRDNLTHAAT